MAAPAPPYGQTEYSQAPPANTHYEQPVPQEQYHQQEPAYPPAAGGAPVGEALPAPGVYVPPQEHAHVHDHALEHQLLGLLFPDARVLSRILVPLHSVRPNATPDPGAFAWNLQGPQQGGRSKPPPTFRCIDIAASLTGKL
ncbi:MAG: hypothetical protein M1837_002161 [Sclerophora amabilis]|nr:MAG: hypothetical protein M1837_002161 [Sclerophora amabilis]